MAKIGRVGASICLMTFFGANAGGAGLALSGRVEPAMQVGIRPSALGFRLLNKGNQTVFYLERQDKKIALNKSSVAIQNSTDTWSIVILAP